MTAAHSYSPPRWAWLPAPVLLGGIIALWAADLHGSWDSPALLMGLNFAFSTLASLGVAFLVGRSFVVRPDPGLLLLGSGALIWGVGSFTASLVAQGNANLQVIIHNVCVWLSAGGLLTGSIVSHKRRWAVAAPRWWVGVAYLLVLALVGWVARAALAGRLPVFFVQGQGGTVVRQFALGSAVLMLVLTAVRLRPAQGRAWPAFAHWYALALVLLACGLVGVMVQSAAGSLLSWMGRAAQYLGGCYMFMAAYVSAGDLEGAILAPDAAPGRRWQQYAVSIATVIAAAALRLVFMQDIGLHATFITFYPAVMLAALYGGLGPGLVATGVSALLADYLWMEPVGFLGLNDATDWKLLGIFCLSGAFISAIVEAMHRAQTRAAVAEERARQAAERERTERALDETRRQNEFLARIIERAAQPFAIGYPDGRLGLCNRAFEELTGYHAEELRTMDWATTLTPPEWREIERQKLVELEQSGQPVRYEKEYVRKDGRRVPIELLVHLARDAQGKPDYYYSFLADITGRKQSEAAVRESEGRLRFALEMSQTGAWDLDLTNQTAFRSLEHDRIFGYPEPLSQWTYEMFLEHVLPEDRPAVDAKFRQANATGSDWTFESRIRRTDGQVRWISGAGRHRPDAAGGMRRMAGVVQDITERKQALQQLQQYTAELQAVNASLSESRHAALNMMEDALRERRRAQEISAELRASQARLADFAAASFEGIVLSEHGRITDCNEQFAKMLGRTVPELKGLSIEQLVVPEDLDRVMANLREGRDSITEHRMLRADGTHITVEAHGRPSGPAGKGLRHTAIRDITERKQREELLHRLLRTLKALKDSSQALMRASSEAAYLNEVCRIVVEDCGHAMVWIGLAQDDEARTVRPVASAGFEAGYLETLKITWADTERGRGPTGTAIRTGKPSRCNNVLTDPALAPWREEAIKRGYRSSLVIPLLADGKAFGALNIYSTQADAISEEEENLLRQLADDISYCIGVLRLRSAKALADLEREKFVSLADNGTEFIGMCDLSLIPFYINAAGIKLVGLDSLEAACRTPVSEFFYPEDRQHMLEEFFPRVLREGRAEIEVRFRHFKTGAPLWMIYAVFYVKDAEGRPVALATVSRNITERRRAERRAELLAGTASQLLSTESPQRMIEDLCDRVLTFLDCQVFLNYLVDEPVGVRGSPSAATVAGGRGRASSGELGGAEAAAPGEGRTPRLVLNSFGGVSEEQRKLIKCLEPGSAVCVCVARDACRIVGEDIQAGSDPRLELVKSFGIQAYACHPLLAEGRVLGTLSFGTRTRTCFTEADLSLMKAVADLVATALERQRASAALRKFNEDLTAANTRMLQTAEELKRSNRDLEQFAYVSSHDLQEPLRAVGGYVKLLERHLAGSLDDKAKGFIAGVFDGALRMERLIQDLLSFSRVGTRGGKLVPTSLDGALQHALANLRASIESSHATVTYEPLPTLAGDPTQLMQVFQNLVGNALKFHGEVPPRIHVGAQRHNGSWAISVRDNGIGIEPEYFEKIFQIFQRLHTRRQYSGTGIGLAICKRIIERHGGSIWVESRAGEGATFYFTVPDGGGG